MKVLAINSSLRGEGQSRTELMLTHLVQGMRQAGAEVEVANLREKKVGFCRGCFTCSSKTPGRCTLQDDMTLELYPKWLEADICVYATPLFHWTVNAPMKAFIERTWPAHEPFFVQGDDGHWHHPDRHHLPAAVVLSVAGFAEDWVFDELSHYAHFLFGVRGDGGLLAEIYRPNAMMMGNAAPDKVQEILEATEEAGRELVTGGSVSAETLRRIRQPLASLETVAQMANVFWQNCVDEGITPKVLEERGLPPRPHSIEGFLALMETGFNAAAAGNARAVLQFDFAGETSGACHLDVGDGRISGHAGPAVSPDLVIHAPFQVWMDVVTGKLDGGQAFMSGRCRAEGNFSLLMQFNKWFGR